MTSVKSWLAYAALPVLLLSISALAPAQNARKQQSQSMQGMMDKCKSMMDMHNKMQTDMKKMDAEIDALVTAMNQAPAGQKKVDAMAVVINKMVEQRKAMQNEMMGMQMQDMQHMGEHMRMGANSMASCPMMQGMQHGSGMGGPGMGQPNSSGK